MAASEASQNELVNLTIDGRPATVPKGTTVYHAVKQLGIEVPIFCYQDRMPPFGACRVCLVEVEKMPKLQTSCTLVAAEGMVVKTQSQMAVEGREGILEFLLINHPLDCPICDRGGECPLQDQTIKFGPGKSRFYEEKRHFVKPLPLGPVLMLDRERCIVCARCTRFGDLVAGDHALEMKERGFRTEVGTPDNKPAESKFIGNTIQICPVGALTSRVYRFRARPWDNTHTESACTLCPVGCSMVLDSRDGELMRTRSCENKSLNDIWLCDKGWFGYEFTDSQERLKTPMIRRDGVLEPATWEEALAFAAAKLQEYKYAGKIAALGGETLTTEENYLFQKLMRKALDVNHVDHRVGAPIYAEEEEGLLPGMHMQIGECEQLDAVYLLGVDITEEFPVIWLRLKLAINRGTRVYYSGYFAPEVEQHLKEVQIHAPGSELEAIEKWLPHWKESKGKKTAIFIGSQYLHSLHRQSLLKLVSENAEERISINILDASGNSMGARLAGMRPDRGALGAVIERPGLNAEQLFEKTIKDGWDLYYIAGANPAAKFPELWSEISKKLHFLIVQDLFLTETARQANVVFPTLSYVEKEGTFVNIEGRLQKLKPGKALPENIHSDAEIFLKLGEKLGADIRLDLQFQQELEKEFVALPKGKIQEQEVQQAPDLNSLSFSAVFAASLFDHGTRMRYNKHLIKLSKEPRVRIHPFDAAKRGLKDGDQVQVSINGKSQTAKIRLDKRVAERVAVLPLGYKTLPVLDLGLGLKNGMPIQIQKVV